MRLIDADALERAVMILPDEELCEDCCYTVVNAIAKAPTVGGWISVKDRLPENGAFVAVQHKVNDEVYTEVAHYLTGRWWLDWDTNGSELNAICWMPLPEPPEEVSGDGR